MLLQVRQLGPRLRRFLARFDDCFHRSEPRSHLVTFVRGLLSDLPRKSVEPIALEAGLPPRTLQQFLSLLDWDHDRMRDQVQQLIAQEHASAHSVGILDDTGCIKKGTKTPGVQRQYSGAAGKIDHCVITVHLAYAAADLHCLLDSDLYLPQSWDQDRTRCQQAGIPNSAGYRPKWKIGLELWQRAIANGVRFSWLTMDEGYAGVPELLRRLHRGEQRFVAEVPTTFSGWLRAPRPGQGRSLQPTQPACAVADLARWPILPGGRSCPVSADASRSAVGGVSDQGRSERTDRLGSQRGLLLCQNGGRRSGLALAISSGPQRSGP